MIPTAIPERPYTAQQILDHVYQHFIVERNPPGITPKRLDGLRACALRAPDSDTPCAVGCLIPDALYAATLETLLVSQLHEVLPELFTADLRGLLEDLQVQHDAAASVESFYEELLLGLEVLADIHKLHFPGQPTWTKPLLKG